MRGWRLILVVMATVSVAACSKSSGSSSGAAKALSCDVQADHLAAQLRATASQTLFGPNPSDSPKVAALRKQLAEIEASQRPRFLAKQLETATGSCKPVTEAVGKIVSVAPTDKAAALAKELPAAVRACDCKVADIDVLEFSAAALLGQWKHP